MNDRTEQQDVLLDCNLKSIGRRIELPAEPTDEQRARWRMPADRRSSPRLVLGVRFMRNHRFLTFAGAGSAVAACIALGALLIGPGGQPPVQAAVIFASFREALSNAFEISLENIGAEGIRVNGRVAVALPDDLSATNAEPKAMYAELRIEASPEADEDIAGLNMRVNIALAPGHEWLYLKMNKFPRHVVQDNPIAMVVLQMARNGLLLELGGLLEGELMEGLLGGLSLADELGDELGEEIQREVRKEVRQEIRKARRKGRVRGAQKADANDDDDQPQFDADEIKGLLKRFVLGKTTRADIDTLASLLEEASGKVEVTKTRDGLYILTARDFDIDEAGDDAKMIENLVMQIAYRDNGGIEWAELQNIGDFGGKLRFTRIELSTDDEMFDKTRVIEPGVTTVINLSQIVQMFKPFIEQKLSGDSD